MTTNRLARSENAERITAPTDPAERIRFWIERGNAKLAEIGRFDVQWAWNNGSYYLEPR